MGVGGQLRDCTAQKALEKDSTPYLSPTFQLLKWDSTHLWPPPLSPPPFPLRC